MAAFLVAICAAAAQPAQAAGRLQRLPVAGTTKEGGFRGSASVVRFDLLGGRPVALALLSGTVTDARYPSPQAAVVRGLKMPVSVQPARGKPCSVLTLTLGPESAHLFGLPGSLDPVRLSLRPDPNRERALAAVTCMIARASKAGDAAALRQSLERLRRLPGGPR
ncbi:MAG: hypothetical protein NVSMB25_15030 [Thermoleophilaceae bacterium]